MVTNAAVGPSPDQSTTSSSLLTTTTEAQTTTTTEADSGGETVYTTNTGKKYHRDGCRYLSESKIPISLSDAIARGLTPCKVCKP